MATRGKAGESKETQVVEIERGHVRYCLLGESPFIANRMSAKVRAELLMPRGRKTAAEKASSLKHDPLAEFRASPYTLREDDAPTLIAQVATAFKKALMGAALDQPGAKKAQVGRLAYCEGDLIPLYGTPELLMSVTRSKDIDKTPDVRSRCILPRWAAIIDFTFAYPLLREPDVTKLLATAGQTQGVGDWRVERGSGNYGRFKIVGPDDPDFRDLIENHGRAVQIAAMGNPAPYDMETSELLSWYFEEAADRGFDVTRAA